MDDANGDGPVPLSVAVMTVSDTRSEENDTSGQYLVEALEEAGHQRAGQCNGVGQGQYLDDRLHHLGQGLDGVEDSAD